MQNICEWDGRNKLKHGRIMKTAQGCVPNVLPHHTAAPPFFCLTARNRREVPCRVKFRLARCGVTEKWCNGCTTDFDSVGNGSNPFFSAIFLQGADTMRKSIIGLILRGVSALLCIMG